MFTNERYIINFFLMNESCISEWKSGEGGTLSKVERHCQSFFPVLFISLHKIHFQCSIYIMQIPRDINHLLLINCFNAHSRIVLGNQLLFQTVLGLLSIIPYSLRIFYSRGDFFNFFQMGFLFTQSGGPINHWCSFRPSY